ncbi:MAG: hypothetical protein ACAH65_08035 [Chloroflexota bacterium]
MPASTTAVAAPSAAADLAGHTGSAVPSLGFAVPQSAAREIAAEASRLLRIRSGELAAPLDSLLPGRRRVVERIVGQLAPIRSRAGLVSSYAREASRDEQVRLAYALAWLDLARTVAATKTRRLRIAGGLRLLRGRS